MALMVFCTRTQKSAVDNLFTFPVAWRLKEGPLCLVVS